MSDFFKVIKIKEKAIIPSLREKRRYLAYEVLSQEAINQEDIKKAITTACKSFLGELEYGKASIAILPNGMKGIIKAENKHLNNVRAAIMMIDNIAGIKIVIRTLGVSGLLNKARQRYIVKIGGK